MEHELVKKVSVHSSPILGVRVDHTIYEESAERIIDLALNGNHGYVCVGTVHMVMEAFDDPSFQTLVSKSAIVTPDGMRLLRALRLLGLKGAQQVYGPTLTLFICALFSQTSLDRLSRFVCFSIAYACVCGI
jgi:N-acetylglucosaminyldiphosphoundecaprenol N-acetyl-beta-D-mannosaminyltransferase